MVEHNFPISLLVVTANQGTHLKMEARFGFGSKNKERLLYEWDLYWATTRILSQVTVHVRLLFPPELDLRS